MTINFLASILLFLYLLLCTFTDICTKKINLKYTLFFFFIGVFLYFFVLKGSLSILFFNLLTGILLIFISRITHGSLGIGDGIIFIIISFYITTYQTLTILFISLFFASLYSIFLLIKHYSKKHTIAFAPFITFAFLTCMYLH